MIIKRWQLFVLVANVTCCVFGAIWWLELFSIPVSERFGVERQLLAWDRFWLLVATEVLLLNIIGVMLVPWTALSKWLKTQEEDG